MTDEIGDDDLYVRFEPDAHVVLGRRRRRPDFWSMEFPLTSAEWERLGELVDEWRSR